VVKRWNPLVNIEALERKVGNDSEDYFDDKFWESLHLCWNALDNIEARKYTDSRCLFYSKALLESGTLGTKWYVMHYSIDVPRCHCVVFFGCIHNILLHLIMFPKQSRGDSAISHVKLQRRKGVR